MILKLGPLDWESSTITTTPLRTPFITPDEVFPELFLIKETALKKFGKVVQVTQVHGSMEAKSILEKISLLEGKKKANVFKQNEKTEMFIRCQHKCSCEKELCEAFGLKMYPTCKSVLKGVCEKVNCRNENGQKPCNLQTLKVSEVY